MKLAVLTTLLAPALATPLLPRETDSASSATNFTHEADWSAKPSASTSFPIHSSCNATLTAQLTRALDETTILARHAKEHLLRWGGESPFVQKYFGNGTTATPIGWYERILSAHRGAMTFRCDDPDENCATQEGWAGHWRGENATDETVICDVSYTKRRYLSSVCGEGYTVANSPLNTFWATDLLHRVLHVPSISEEVVDHFTGDYEGLLEQAKEEPEKSAIDSDALQYFAIDVYAYDIAAPGKGCTGDEEEEEEEDDE